MKFTMDNQSVLPNVLRRDGTSQIERMQAALDPDYVVIDERSIKDLLVFAQAYAKKLRYFDVVNGDVMDVGNWQGFISEDLDLDEVIAFLENPKRFSFATASRYSRPHFALFLTFLKLLQHAQKQLNMLTRWHLEFYYQQVLGMSKQPGIPDQVNVLVDAATGTNQFLLPAGTMLNAGADSKGLDLYYQTKQDIVVNRAQIAQIKSLYAHRKVTGIRQAREEQSGTVDEGFLAMLQIALGSPSPGGPVKLSNSEKPLEKSKLDELKELIDFVRNTLFMDAVGGEALNSNYVDFRNLMKFKHEIDASDPEWEKINNILIKANEAHEDVEDIQQPFEYSRAFDANIKIALGDHYQFSGLSEVEDIYDLYARRINEPEKAWIENKLKFEFTDFVEMMQIKTRLDGEWMEIHRILKMAWLRSEQLSEFTPVAIDVPDAFNVLFTNAVGEIDYTSFEGVTNLDNFYSTFQHIETSFFMSAEDFAYMVRVGDREKALHEKDKPLPTDWVRVYSILAAAHIKKEYATRRQELKTIHENQDFGAMISFATGGNVDSEETTLERLLEFVFDDRDADFLRGVDPDNTLEDWDRVYRIVELAQRLRQKLPQPVAQKIDWLNLFPSDDATSLAVSLDIDEDETPRWRTFGWGQASENRNTPPPTSFGWAINSPMLALSQGKRVVELTLGFESKQFESEKINRFLPDTVNEPEKLPFLLEASTEKGWVSPTRIEYQVDDYHALTGVEVGEDVLQAIQIRMTFDEGTDPITPPMEDAGLHSHWPVLRLLLRPLWNEKLKCYQTPYHLFKNLMLQRCHLLVRVTNLTPSHLQNDERVINPGKPFEPFGNNALAGSRLYIGHPELVLNKLDSLRFNIEWMGIPPDLVTHYKNYKVNNADPDSDDLISSPDEFKVEINLVDRKRDIKISDGHGAELFITNSLINSSSAEPDLHPIAEDFQRLIDPVTDDDLLQWERYLQWELNEPDFQHGVYPSLAVQKALELSAAIANKDSLPSVDSTHYQVNPPYTPKIKALTIDYTASVEIEMAVYNSDAQIDHLYHIEPFGYREISPDTSRAASRFLPPYDYEGELYIGIEACYPPQNLSILFQMAEGSADPELEPAPITWSYLSGDRWLSLDDGKILQDTTRSLINSGIITFDLKPTAPSDLLPSNLYWIRAAIPHNSRGIADTVAIHTQAVSATFVDQNNASDHLSQPLPTESITDLARRNSAVEGIRQPYTSFGGKMAEADTFFYTRISERLRHKQRAITMWDYEHLILERFPEIYKVKCLPAQPDKPGEVTVVVIPDIRHKRPFDPFAPKAPANLIADIKTFLADITPPSATVTVKNAAYVPVKVRVGVRFRPGYNEGFYIQQLNNDLRRFLSPWAYAETAEIEIGGRIYANIIINFIEERPYIDYIAKIKLFTNEDGRRFQEATPSISEGYSVGTPRLEGVLVSARQHDIDLISETGYEEENFTGIGYMKIELDFIIGNGTKLR